MVVAQENTTHFRDKYELGSPLGKGSFATVYECIHRHTKKRYAVKVIDTEKTKQNEMDDLKHEIKVMQTIGYHPNVVQLIEYFVTSNHMYLVVDLLSGGMLFDRIVELKHYSEQNASELVQKFLSALKHIHGKGIIHRDLKPENLLLRYSAASTPTEQGYLTDVCLADFGLAGEVPCYTCCGSPSYIAPEVISVGYLQTRKEPYNEKADIWSLGVITYILLSGRMPFHGSHFKQTFQSIVNGQYKIQGDIWDEVSSSAKNFVALCLTADPTRRPTADQLLNHDWITTGQSNKHLTESLENLREFNARQKFRSAVRVFCCAHSLLGKKSTLPPFIRYLSHRDKLSSVIEAQSQTDSSRVHYVDYAKALNSNDSNWKMQDCCTCPSEMVCRHIQNVYEYLFVGKRSMDVYPFVNELLLMKNEGGEKASNDNEEESIDVSARADFLLKAAKAFAEEFSKVSEDSLKPNFMLEGSKPLFRWKK